jgi:N-acetylglucosaminyldiphosphoundecaprenol N-acetyl-beta-D-mannosaminyltransferase
MKAVDRRFDVLGVGIDAITMDEAVATLNQLVRSRAKGYFVFCTVSSVLSARDNPHVARAIDDAAIVTPDGVPLVWLGRRASDRPIERVYGPDFLRSVLDRGAGLRHFFYGGAPGVAQQVSKILAARYPNSEVAGGFSPPMGLEPGQIDEEGAAAIAAARPDVVWVGLGHPKQELWMQTMSDHLDVPVLAGVGAAFDFIAGTKKEAPAWMKRAGLQWLHRLVSEPTRLWRRYILGNSRFVWLLARERFRRPS